MLFDKDMGMYLVEMYEKTNDGMKKHATVPMITGQVIHERMKDMQNWVPRSYYKEHINDNEKQ